jgi:hypothetical protein
MFLMVKRKNAPALFTRRKGNLQNSIEKMATATLLGHPGSKTNNGLGANQ